MKLKLSNKKMTLLSFTLGACVFVSTAFADVLLGSGYDQLKSSAKTTAAQMDKGLNNYTIEALFTLKDNDQPMLQASIFNKVDTGQKATENKTVTQYTNGKTTSHYSYADEQRSIWKSEMEDKYYVTEFPDDYNKDNWHHFTNPFNEKGAPEIEKIVDALVGNLKDNVQAEERPEGGRLYSGSLSATQVPAVVNAVSSFGIKQMIRDQGRMEGGLQIDEMESDVYVKKVSGTAVENKAGLLENVTGNVILSGKDTKGVQHDLNLSIVFKLSDIGNTKISMPNLTGANVEKVSQFGGITSKYVGTYKNNIILEKDGKFVKIGERVIEITNVENSKVIGKYYETVKPGFETDFPEVYSFPFEYKQNQARSMFTYTNPKGKQEQGQIHPSSPGKIYLDLNVEKIDENSYRSNNRPNYDQEFNRVFAE